MSAWSNLGNIWKIIGEMDLAHLYQEIQDIPRLALIGSPAGMSQLQEHLQQGPHATSQQVTVCPMYRLPLAPDQVLGVADYDLRVLMLDDLDQARDSQLQAIASQPAHLITILNAAEVGPISSQAAFGPGVAQAWQPSRVLVCPLEDKEAVHKIVFPALLERLPGRELALGHAYPGLRPAVTQELIQDTSMANATYAFTTGIGEIVPALTIPLTAADILILTKNQIIMAYKISLAMGEAATLREILPKLISIVGVGFMWRQIARTLVGLVPGWGIIPKVAVAYAGTYASGQALYQWYVTGERLQDQDLRELFQQALQRGRAQAVLWSERLRRQQDQAAATPLDAGMAPELAALPSSSSSPNSGETAGSTDTREGDGRGVKAALQRLPRPRRRRA